MALQSLFIRGWKQLSAYQHKVLALLDEKMHFVLYYPAEALSEPIFRTWHFLWRMWNKK